MKKLKKTLALLLAMSMLMSSAAFAADGEEDGDAGEQTAVVCTQSEDCAAETHEANCPKYVAPNEDKNEVTSPADDNEEKDDLVHDSENSNDLLALASEEQETVARVDTLDELTYALTNDTVVTIILSGTINTSEQIDITRDLTLEGDTSDPNSGLNYTNNSSDTSRISALQVYGAKVTIKNLTISHNTGAALLVNGGAIVTVDNLSTYGSGWGAINVDKGSTLIASNLDCGENVKIWSEDYTGTDSGSQIAVDGLVPVFGLPGEGTKVHFMSSADANQNAAATVGGVYYGTLQGAVDAAENGQTVVMLKDCNKKVTVGKYPADGVVRAITLDLNGCEINVQGTGNWAYGIFLQGDDKLTIQDTVGTGKIVATPAAEKWSAGISIWDNAELVVENGTIQGSTYGISGNGSKVDGTNAASRLTITGGTIIATSEIGTGIYHPDPSRVVLGKADDPSSKPVIRGGATGIEIRAGELEIYHAEIVGATVVTDFSEAPNAGGTTVLGAGLAIVQHTTKNAIKVTIHNADIRGIKSVYEKNLQGNPAADVAKIDLDIQNGNFTGAIESENLHEFISGGTFSSDVSDYCLPGTMWDDETHGIVAKVDNDTVATVGNVAYNTLAEAFAAVNNAPGTEPVTLTVRKNCGPTANEQLRITRDYVTIDGGKNSIECGTFSVSGQAGILIAADHVTVKDLKIGVSGNNVDALKVSKVEPADAIVNDVELIGLTLDSNRNGHGLNLHGVKNATVTGMISTGTKCGLSLANAQNVTVNNSEFHNHENGWSYSIQIAYKDNDFYKNPVTLTLGEKVVLDHPVIYSERPASAQGGRDTVTLTAPLTADIAGAKVVNSENLTTSSAVKVESADGSAVYYSKLDDAINAAGSGDTVKLLQNANGNFLISGKSGITLDGNGHAITCGEGNDAHGLQVYCSDNVTLKNVTVTGAGKSGLLVNASSVTVEGKLDLTGNGKNDAEDAAFKWGSVINVAYGENISGAHTTSLTFASGATLEGVDTVYSDKDDMARAAAAGEGNTITVNAVPGRFQVVGSADTPNLWTTEANAKASAVAQVSNSPVFYATLQAAMEAARNRSTVTLLANLNESVTVFRSRSVSLILDLNGKTLTGNGGPTILINEGTLNITGTGTVTNAGAYNTIENYGILTISENVAVTASGASAIVNQVQLTLSGNAAVTASGGHTIANRNTLDVSGNATVTNTGAGNYGALANYTNASATLNGGTFTDDTWYTIKNLGSMTITGATVQRADNDAGSSLIDNGWYGNLGNDLGESKPSDPSTMVLLTINGGTFIGGMNTVKNDDFGNLTINGGTFTNVTQAVIQNHHVASITGGTFEISANATGTTYGVDNCGCDHSSDVGQVEITGGTFTGATYAVYDRSTIGSATIEVTGGDFSGTNAAVATRNESSFTQFHISGGTYSHNVPEAYCTDVFQNQYRAVKDLEKGKYKVVAASEAVAKIGDVYYSSLADAIEDAAGDQTVTLVQDVTLTQPLVIDKKIILDGNSIHTITASASADGQSAILVTTNGVQIKNLTLTAGENKPDIGIQVQNAKDVALSTLTINNMGQTALLVDSGSQVTATDLNTQGNAVGAVNVDPSSAFTFNSGNLTETTKIWGDYTDPTASHITVPEGWTSYTTTNDGKTQIFYTTTMAPISLDQPTLSMTVGYTVSASVTLQVSGAPAGATVTWTSSDASVATVSENGVVTAVAAGTATITATVGSATARCLVTVDEIVPTVVLDQAAATITEGNTLALTATVTPEGAEVTWTSDDTSVATVNENGVVTAVAAGTATITATVGKVSAICTVTVTEVLPTVTLDRTTASITRGNTLTLTVTVTPADAEVTWTSNNPAVATVNENGVVTAVAAGISTITATVGRVSAACTVTVTNPSTPPVGPGTGPVNPPVDPPVDPIDPPVDPDEGEDLEDPDEGEDLEDPDTPLVQRPFTFVDVPQKKWFYNDVKTLFDMGLINGMGVNENGDDVFQPNTNSTRAMVATMLYRLAGSPSVEDLDITIVDVSARRWYHDATVWSYSEGIFNGVDKQGSFCGGQIITREQLAAVLYRYAASLGLDMSVRGDLSRFTDSGKVSRWARESMEWAVGVGLISGHSDGRLAARDPATRAQLSTVFVRFLDLLPKEAEAENVESTENAQGTENTQSTEG